MPRADNIYTLFLSSETTVTVKNINRKLHKASSPSQDGTNTRMSLPTTAGVSYSRRMVQLARDAAGLAKL